MVGRKPVPRALKVARGTDRPFRRRDEPEPQQLDAPHSEPPRHLRGQARKEWIRIVPILTASRVMTAADWSTVALYCQFWAEHLDGIKAGDYRRWSDAGMKHLKCAVELGLTPSARYRVKVEPEKKADGKEKAHFG